MPRWSTIFEESFKVFSTLSKIELNLSWFIEFSLVFSFACFLNFWNDMGVSVRCFLLLITGSVRPKTSNHFTTNVPKSVIYSRPKTMLKASPDHWLLNPTILILPTLNRVTTSPHLLYELLLLYSTHNSAEIISGLSQTYSWTVVLFREHCCQRRKHKEAEI